MVAGIIIGAVVLVLLLWGVTTYNKFVRLKNNCEEAFSTMDVYLKKRFDLIPNVVNVVKGYAKHEAETLEKVIAARNTMQTANINEQVDQENIITGAMSRFIALAEQYPDLKANQNFLDLSSQLKSIENDIANARKYYNGNVKIYNTKCMSIPSNIIANIGGFKKMSLFQVSNEAERENVKVEF